MNYSTIAIEKEVRQQLVAFCKVRGLKVSFLATRIIADFLADAAQKPQKSRRQKNENVHD